MDTLDSTLLLGLWDVDTPQPHTAQTVEYTIFKKIKVIYMTWNSYIIIIEVNAQAAEFNHMKTITCTVVTKRFDYIDY